MPAFSSTNVSTTYFHLSYHAGSNIFQRTADNLNRVWKGGAISLLCGCTPFKLNTLLSQAKGSIGNPNTLISPLHAIDYTVSHLGQLPGLINAPLTHCVTLSQSRDQTAMPLLLYPANAIKRTSSLGSLAPRIITIVGSN